MQDVLWLETILKLAGGLALILVPRTVIKIFGLPPAETGFWPRILGALLAGLAAATFIEGAGRAGHGLGLAGLVAINLASAAALFSLLTLGAAATTRRGQAVLWALFATLLLLALFEIAYV